LTEKEIEKCGWIGEKVKAGLKAGTDIIWFYDDKIKQIIIMEKPDNFAKSLRGLGKEIWKDNDANMYVQEERNSWQ